MNKPLGGKSSGLPKPSSGLKPPQIINKPTGKRPLESTSSKDLSVNLPKRQRSTVTNLTKVIKRVILFISISFFCSVKNGQICYKVYLITLDFSNISGDKFI